MKDRYLKKKKLKKQRKQCEYENRQIPIIGWFRFDEKFEECKESCKRTLIVLTVEMKKNEQYQRAIVKIDKYFYYIFLSKSRVFGF